MLVIRLSRIGKRNHPHYRVVLTEKTYPVQGKFIELLGSYDPHQKVVQLKEQRIKHWLKKGAKCSDTAHNLLVKNGLLKEPKIKFEFKSKAAQGEATQESGQESKPAPKEEKGGGAAKENSQTEQGGMKNEKKPEMAEEKKDQAE